MRSAGDILYNFHWVLPGEVARSSQAYAGFLGTFLERHAIRSVINLRGANPRHWWWRYETNVCSRLGITHFDVRLNSRNLPPQRILLDLLDSFDGAEAPLLIKCSGGQDRSSFASALFLVHRHGWEMAHIAHEQFAGWPYLHWPKPQQRWMKVFIPYLADRAPGRPVSEWIGGAYTPEDFARWLGQRGMQDCFRPLADGRASGGRMAPQEANPPFPR
jgi:hypothetical protein